MLDIVVTDFGITSPIGISVPEFEKRMFAGDSGIIDLRGSLVGNNFPVAFGGVVDDTNIPPATELGLPLGLHTNGGRYLIHALQQILQRLPESVPIDALVQASPAGIYFDIVRDSLMHYDPDSFIWDELRAEWVVEIIAEKLKQRGHGSIDPENIISVNSACAAGSQAIGVAYHLLKSGRIKRCLVCAVDAGAWESQLMNFHLLHTLTTDDVPAHTASRPFSKSRSGFVKSEAAAVLLLETRAAAEERKAEILAQVCGYAFNSDAYRLTDGRDDNQCVVRAMEDAIADAGIEKTEIGYINAHGTSTVLNDRLETQAIKKVFGENAYQIPVSSLKSQIGHSTVAAGAVEAIACILMLLRQKITPTINLHDPDPDCDLDYVPEGSRDVAIDYILSNSFGFGGQNACLVLKKERN
ncbi:beta-ketoacyl-[acyl-carrier-protein] synthase family protein [Chlorobium phaeobacteroides]|uniref:Beta-ketoacyl synthase n=1 Tax=Chlorobium phaeobacteroides (strain DSM 266 / SMG 266 / 2430) TaxID=290317 RepID=A1BFG7_CHLPD|nr:beta-ketoacyl-[acyl-carrier-protein] synthase family protein [Chlorobium phaeobacteroides]ABL65144.1 beta-ketoacyl synthase [Chlorobium phaeobacteroides DSM 266]